VKTERKQFLDIEGLKTYFIGFENPFSVFELPENGPIFVFNIDN
jgi:hypothetical protein